MLLRAPLKVGVWVGVGVFFLWCGCGNWENALRSCDLKPKRHLIKTYRQIYFNLFVLIENDDDDDDDELYYLADANWGHNIKIK